MSINFHVPDCEDDSCAENLHSLVEKLRKKHVTVVENKLCGCFKEIFVEQFETSSFTILHKCEQFWIKLKSNGLDVYSKEHADKIMCVKLKNSSSLYTTPINGEETVDCFFQHFNVKSVTNEKNLQIFVEAVLSSFPDAGNQEELKKKKPILPQRHKHVSREVSQTDLRHVNLYDNAPVEEKVILEKLETLRSHEEKKSIESEHRLMPYPEDQGKNKESNVYARVMNKAEHAQFIISYSSIRSFAELKDKIKELRKCPEKFPANINFLIHKVLPELYHSNSALGIVHIAVCCDYPLLQRRSFDHIELLILKGQIKNSHVDLDTLQYMQKMLAKSIHDLSLTRRPDIHTESAITRSCNIIIMLQIETMMNFNETDIVNESDEFLSDMRSTLKTCKSLKNTEKYVTTMQKVLESHLESIHHEVHNYFSENGTLDLSNRANYILGKSLAFQFAVILDCLKKLFLKMDVAVLDLLLECFRPKKWFIKKTLAPAVCSILLRGLTHFLFYGLREIPHINIHNLCHKVMAVIDNLSKQNLPSEISILNSLMFDTTPVIRQCTIDFFDKNKCYDSWLNVYLLRELEHKLAPHLEVDQEAKTALKDDNLNEEWLSLTGNFCNLPAGICIHRPSKEAHKSGHIINFNDKTRSRHRTHINQIELLQHLDHCNIVELLSFHIESIPQFYILETSSSLQDYLINKNINQQYCTYVQLVEFLRQAASALFYCHNMGIIHANITAASFLISSTGDTVKLSGFLFAVTNDNDTLSTEDSSLLPSRWCAPETLKRLKVSERSDSWMFGHLIYEILTHGVLPYSHVQLDDETCVKKICNKKIKLCRETCIDSCHYDVIEKCISHDPRMRPTMQDIHAFFEWKNIKASHQTAFPNYHNGHRAPSRDFKLGVICLEYYVDMIQPKILQQKISEALSLYKVGEVAVVTEVTDRLFTEEIMTKLNIGILDFILPRIHATVTQDKKQCIEIFLPPSCHESLMQLLLSPDFDSSEENCIRLMLNVAEMLQKLHELSFVMGDMCASYLFVRKQKGKLTLHPISLSKLNTIDESNSKLNKVHFDELVLRRTAPEVMKDNMATVTPESDVFSFGCLMWEILELSCCLKESESLRTERTYVSMTEILSNEININDVRQQRCNQKPIINLIQRCLHVQPKERPNFKEIIRVLSRQLYPYHTEPKVVAIEQSSETSAKEHETIVKQASGTSSEQNDQTKNKKKKVKIPFLCKRLSKSPLAVKPNDYEIDNKEDETQPKQIYVSNHNTDVLESNKDFIYRPKEIQRRRLNSNLYHGAIQTRPLPKVPEFYKLQHESKQFSSDKPSLLLGNKNNFQNKDDQKITEEISALEVSFSMDSSGDETRSEDDELYCRGPSHNQKSSADLPNIPHSDKVYHAKPLNFQANYVLSDFISPVNDVPNPLPHKANTTRLGYNNLTQQTLASNNVSRYIYKTVEKLDPDIAPDFEQFYQEGSSSDTLKTSDLLLDYGCAWRPLHNYPYFTSYGYSPFDKTRLFPSCDYIQPLSPMGAEEDDFIPVIMHQKYVGRENSTCPIGVGVNSTCQIGVGVNSTCPIGIGENSTCQIGIGENSSFPIRGGENSACEIGIGENFICQIGPYDSDQSINQHCRLRGVDCKDERNASRRDKAMHLY